MIFTKKYIQLFLFLIVMLLYISSQNSVTNKTIYETKNPFIMEDSKKKK